MENTITINRVFYSDALTNIDVALSKANAILDAYHDNNYLGSSELTKTQIMQMANNHEEQSLLFQAALDYLQEAIKRVNVLADLGDNE